MTKDEFKRELLDFKRGIEDLEKIQEELKEEDPEIADILESAEAVITVMSGLKLMTIIARFLGVDPNQVNIKQ